MNANNKKDIEKIIQSIVPELQQSCGASIASEVEKILMSIPQGFDEKIREHLKNLEENIIKKIEEKFG